MRIRTVAASLLTAAILTVGLSAAASASTPGSPDGASPPTGNRVYVCDGGMGSARQLSGEKLKQWTNLLPAPPPGAASGSSTQSGPGVLKIRDGSIAAGKPFSSRGGPPVGANAAQGAGAPDVTFYVVDGNGTSEQTPCTIGPRAKPTTHLN